MEISPIYIFSQICVIMYYILVIATYQIKSRKKILIMNMVGLIIMGISYFCLSAYSGVSMVILGIVRNTMFYIDEVKGKNSEKITKHNVVELTILIVLAAIFSIFTYEGLLSLMSVAATMIYTISIWQKNTKVYRLLGIPIGVAGILYNVYIKSILGIVFEGFSFISAAIGSFREIFKKK